ncbi:MULTISPECIES: hypothetical protein [unclassified Microcoleus]|uniref:hypothetical protein n=1 Tax=unclassified Microcoleus TaxID=2642155 RepID=UPI002FD20E04
MTAKHLEEIGEALKIPPQPRQTKVIEMVTDEVTDKLEVVTDAVIQNRIAALETRLQLMEERLGKLRAVSESPTESLRPDTTEEVESLRQSLERSDTLIKSRNQEISDLRFRLAAKDEIIAEADEQIEKLESERQEFAETKKLYNEGMRELMSTEKSIEGEQMRTRTQLTEAETKLREANSKLLQQSNTIRELEREPFKFQKPAQSKTSAIVGAYFSKVEAADLLNQLKAKRKKSKADLVDVEALLDLLSSSP